MALTIKIFAIFLICGTNASKRFDVHRTGGSWSTASAMCRSTGGRLAEPKTLEELATIKLALFGLANVNQEYWLGIMRRDATTSEFQYASFCNTTLPSTLPLTISIDGNCVTHNETGKTLHAIRCDRRKRFICEVEATTNVPCYFDEAKFSKVRFTQKLLETSTSQPTLLPDDCRLACLEFVVDGVQCLAWQFQDPTCSLFHAPYLDVDDLLPISSSVISLKKCYTELVRVCNFTVHAGRTFPSKLSYPVNIVTIQASTLTVLICRKKCSLSVVGGWECWAWQYTGATTECKMLHSEQDLPTATELVNLVDNRVGLKYCDMVPTTRCNFTETTNVDFPAEYLPSLSEGVAVSQTDCRNKCLLFIDASGNQCWGVQYKEDRCYLLHTNAAIADDELVVMVKPVVGAKMCFQTILHEKVSDVYPRPEFTCAPPATQTCVQNPCTCEPCIATTSAATCEPCTCPTCDLITPVPCEVITSNPTTTPMNAVTEVKTTTTAIEAGTTAPIVAGTTAAIETGTTTPIEADITTSIEATTTPEAAPEATCPVCVNCTNSTITNYVYVNLTKVEQEHFITKILQQMTIDKKNVSFNIRRYTSARDDRVSAYGLGLMGILVMSLMMVALLLSDAHILIRDGRKMCASFWFLIVGNKDEDISEVGDFDETPI